MIGGPMACVFGRCRYGPFSLGRPSSLLLLLRGTPSAVGSEVCGSPSLASPSVRRGRPSRLVDRSPTSSRPSSGVGRGRSGGGDGERGSEMPHRARPMTGLLVFMGVNLVLVSTISPVYDFVCFHPYWERRVRYTPHAWCRGVNSLRSDRCCLERAHGA